MVWEFALGLNPQNPSLKEGPLKSGMEESWVNYPKWETAKSPLN